MHIHSDTETGNTIPCFYLNQTALYVSCTTRKPSLPLSALQRITTRVSALLLLKHGYNTLIVDYGTPFGKDALHELVTIRQQKHYTLIAVKVIGEHNYYSNRLEEIKELAGCDLSLGLVGKHDFLTSIVKYSNIIINGIHIHRHCGRISIPLLEYIKQLP